MKKIFLILSLSVLLSTSLFTSTYAYSGTSSNSGYSSYVFYIGEDKLFFPFGARVNYKIDVDYATQSNGIITLDRTGLFAYCDLWAGENLCDLELGVGYQATVNYGSTTIGTLNLYEYPVLGDPSWVTYDYRESSVSSTYTDSPLKITGTGGVLVADPLYPTGTFSISTTVNN